MNANIGSGSLTPYLILVGSPDFFNAVIEYLERHFPGLTILTATNTWEAISTMHQMDRPVIFIVEDDLPDTVQYMGGILLVNEHVRKTFRFDAFCIIVTDNAEVIDKASGSTPPILCRPKTKIEESDSTRRIYSLDFHLVGHVRYAMGRLKELERDALTGFYTRKAGLARLYRDYRRARTHRVPLSLVYIDVNDLKLTNDTYGHSAGDSLLEAFAEVVHAAIRERREFDCCIRIGADEFVIVLYKAGTQGAKIVMARLQERLSQVGVEIAPNRLMHPSVAMGAATLSWRKLKNMSQEEGVENLFKTSDKKMYENKRQMKTERWLAIKGFITNTWIPTQLLLTHNPHRNRE